MRECQNCKELKPLTDYMKRGERANLGVYSHIVCKTCRRKSSIQRYGNSEKGKACSDRWRSKKENGEKANKNSVMWQKNNPDKVSAIRERTIKKNKDKISKKLKSWRREYALFDSYGEKLSLYEESIENRNGYLFVRCTYCDKWMQPTNQMIGARLGVLYGHMQGESRFYCSDNCKKACPVFNQKLYYKGQSVKSSSREVMPELRKMALLRDGHRCQDCGENGECDQLHVHHIKPVADDPIESADLDNVVTLCKQCHIQVHRVPGCGFLELSCKALIKDKLLSRKFRFISAEDLETEQDEYVGKSYGKVTVLKRDFEYEEKKKKQGSRYYFCKCECGKQKTIAIQKLKTGHTRSCGCEKYVQVSPGDKCGILTAIEPTDQKVGRSMSRHYLCKCECGNVIPVSVSLIKSKSKYSCGCKIRPHKETHKKPKKAKENQNTSIHP